MRDVAIHLTNEEVEELIISLSRLKDRPELKRIYLTDASTGALEQEMTFALADPSVQSSLSPESSLELQTRAFSIH